MTDQASPRRIDSTANPRVAAAARLRERRERDRTGLTLVDGAREARRAIDAGADVTTAFVALDLVRSDEARAVVDLLRGTRRQAVVEVGERAFGKVAFGDRSDGIVLVVRPRLTTLPEVALGPVPLVVVTEDVEKPGNLGAILRSADGIGADAVVAVGGTDLFNPNVIRASLGTVFAMPVAAGTAIEVQSWLRSQGLRIVTARVDAAKLHVDTDLTGPLAVVLGSEAEGLSPTWTGPDVEAVRLPMSGVADSLNVSAAAAVLLYEAWRQRRAADG